MGRPQTKETRRKISEAMKGNKNGRLKVSSEPVQPQPSPIQTSSVTVGRPKLAKEERSERYHEKEAKQIEFIPIRLEGRGADRVINFIESYCCHTKAEWTSQNFHLRNWQKEIIEDIFNTLKPVFPEEGEPLFLRQYKKAYISMARKNGKSELMAALALFLLCDDDELGKEIVIAAGDREQAGLIFGMVKWMVESNKSLSSNLKVWPSTKSIGFVDRNSYLKAVSSESYSKHGMNLYAAICDELHIWPNRELWDVLETSFGVRKQPLMLGITTSGFDKTSLCWELYEYARQVKTGVLEDDTFYSKIYELGMDEDWKNQENWKKANPALGDFRKLEEMQELFNKAKNIPAFENSFRRLYLNQWTASDTRFLPMSYWDACAATPGPILEGRTCYAGLDLSATTDLSALCLVFKPEEDGIVDVLVWFWMPEANIEYKSKTDKVDYGLWVRQGFIEATPGNRIDYGYIRKKINELAKKYRIAEIAFDPWNAVQLGVELEQQDALPLIQVRQSMSTMSPPTKELLKLTLGKEIRHGGNPVLRWNADSVTVVQDAAGNVRPDKSKSTARIDGIVALVYAIDRLSRQEGPSVYETRGPLVMG